MKITGNRAALVAALTMCKSAAASKSPMVALQTTLLELGDGELLVSATDLFVGARVGVAAKITGDRDPVAIDAGEILDRVRAMATDEVTIETKAGAITVTGGKRKFKLLGVTDLPPTRPTLPEGEPQIRMAPSKFAALLTSAGHATGDESRNPALTCIRFRWTTSAIEAASADGHRIVVEKIDHACKDPGAVLIPARASGEIKKLCEAGGDEIRLWFEGPHVFADIDGAVVWAKLQDIREYPGIENAIVDRLPGALVVERVALADAARAISIASGRIEGHTQIHLASKAGVLSVSGSDAAKGEGAEDIDCEYSGHPWELNCNSVYLVQALQACASERVALSIGAPTDPIRIDPSEKQTGRSVVAVVAPSFR